MNIQNQPPRTAAEEALKGFLDARLVSDPVEGPLGAHVTDLRRAGRDAFARFGLPHRRVEEWKYTDLRALLRTAPTPAGALSDADAAEGSFRVLSIPGARRILFVNGVLSRAYSDLHGLEAGLSVLPLASALAGGRGAVEKLGTLAPERYDGPYALNTAYLGEGLVIHVAEGAKIERPLHVAHIFTGDEPATLFARRLVDVAEGAKLTLVESFQGPDGRAYVTNDAVELFVGDHTHVDYVRVQEEGDAALHLGTFLTHLGKDAKFHSFALTSGAAASRLSVYGRFAGAHTQGALRGATLARGRQHADITLLLDHVVPHCESRELFKTVLADEAKGVFQGKIIVHREAQKTDGRMMSQSLLLGEAAEMDNKPELEIFADDVQCGHGATAGAINEDLLFYLMARGIPAKEAEALLIQAFVGEAIEFVEHDALREALMTRAVTWLKKRAG